MFPFHFRQLSQLLETDESVQWAVRRCHFFHMQSIYAWKNGENHVISVETRAAVVADQHFLSGDKVFIHLIQSNNNF